MPADRRWPWLVAIALVAAVALACPDAIPPAGRSLGPGFAAVSVSE